MPTLSSKEITLAQKHKFYFLVNFCFLLFLGIAFCAQAQDVAVARNREIVTYSKSNFPYKIRNVIVDKNNVTIRGDVAPNVPNLFLCELRMYDETRLTANSFASVTPINAQQSSFEIQLQRIVNFNDTGYDRIYSRWVIASKNGNNYQVQSYANYAEDINRAARQYLPEEKPANKKGLGGFFAIGGVNQDLKDLGLKNVTVNVVVPSLISLTPTADSYNLNGQTYYFNPTVVGNFDKTFKLCSDNDVFVSAILLIQENLSGQLKQLFVYRDANAGIQSMANLTSLSGLNYYAAVIGFLADRYTRPDKKYGRINNWIVHNEVDNGAYWTNAGNTQMEDYTELYDRSLRTVYYTVRQYDPAAKVFLSLSHFWASAANNKFFPPKDMLAFFSELSKKQGDYEWGVAYHPYPQDSFNPKTWTDKDATMDINTAKYLTPKNIELIDQWMCMQSHLYKGLKVRSLIFSEEGVHSKSYNQDDLMQQAAGVAYMWKKLSRLPTAEAIDYHRQVDNLNEGGIKPGLWMVKQGTKVSPGERKPAWYVYQKAGTPSEDSAFAFALPIIGITSWSQVFNPLREEAPPVKVTFNVTSGGAALNDVSVYFNGEMHRTIDGKAIFYNVAALSRNRTYRVESAGKIIYPEQNIVVTKDQVITVNVSQ